MHERGVARRLLELTRDLCDQHQVRALRGVRVEVGEFAGIEPLLLQTAFDEQCLSYFEKPVELELQMIPLSARCQSCGQTAVVKDFRFECPACAGRQLELLTGEELRITGLITDEESGS